MRTTSGPFPKMSWTRAATVLPAAIYIVLSLLIGDTHPFSHYRMYASLPDEVHVVVLRDAQGKAVPLGAHFSLSAADLSHMYDAAVLRHGDDVDALGRQLWAQLAESILPGRPLPAARLIKLQLHADGHTAPTDEQLLYTHPEDGR